MLDIRLLGTPRVFLRGEGISIPRKTTRSLLFYLAMHPKGVRRDELVELFFGHQDGDEVQRKSLRRYLNFVRNISKGDEFVENYHDTIRLKASFVKVDALVLLATVEKIKRSNGFRDDGCTLPLGIYQEALDSVSLLEGDTFIDSNDMDKIAALSLWKEAENSRLRNARNSLFMFLAEMDLRQGNPEKASLWAERALELDESEDAHYLLLKSLREMDQLDKARKHYLGIQEDFGSGISEKLRSLGEEILNVPETSALYVRPDWAIRPSVPVPFVGQSAILERLQINHQRGVGTLITGEAGSGKTRLVKAFFEELPRTSNLLLVPCYRDSERLSYQPWTDMLRHSFHEEFWQSTPVWWTRPLTMLLPELLVYRDDLDVKPSEVFSNELVFEAVKNLLIFANQKSAALLFVEDAHWMNPISFALLKYLILQSTFKQWNIGLVVTSRLGIHSGVDRFEFDAMMGKIEEIEISRLGDEEIKYLALYLLNDKLSADKIAALKKMTGGNPFFLLEFLSFHKLNDDVDIFKDSVSSPPSVQQLIEVRLKPLTPKARKLLNYAAVQGYHFDLAILEEVLMLPMEEMTALIAELEEARLVHFLSKDDGLHYAFFHENLRSDIINLLSPAKQRVLHAKFADVLAQKSIYQNEWAAVLAEHYEQAGAFSEAFSAWFTAAKHAYRIFSSKDAHIAYQHAEALLPHLSFSENELYEFYTKWGRMLFNSDDPDALEVVMQSMLAHGERLSSGLLLGAALDGLSDVHMARNEFEEGLECAEDALAYLIMDGHIPAQMNAFIHQGVFLYMLNNFPAALESFNTVLSLGAGRTDDPQTTFAIGHANYQIAASLTGMGYPQNAIRYAKESIRVMRLSSMPHTSILAHSIMGLANYYLGHYDEGKQNALFSLELAQKSKSWRMAGYAVAYAGMNETELSEFGPAWEHAEQAIQYGKQYGHTEIVSMGYKVFGDIYTRLDALVQAAKFYQRGVDVDNASFAKLENAARLGVTLGLLSDPRADAVLEEALTHAKTAGLETIEINAKALQLSLFITRKEYAAFDADLDDIRTALTERSDPKSVVWIDYLQAVRLFQEEQYEEALALLEKTLSVLEETHFFWIRLSAYKLYLELLKALERDLAPTRTKLAEMLNQIEANLGDAPLQEEWQIFSERIKEM